MIIHKGYNGISFRNPVITMGIFDGVHRGHIATLNYLIEKAKQSNGESVVITIIYPQTQDRHNFYLATQDEKYEALNKTGIDHLIEIEFDEEIKQMRAADFIKNILVDKIGAKHIISGYDQYFGRGGEGNFETLKQYSAALRYTVEQLPEIKPEGNKVSSSVIRQLLLAGDLDSANSLLGYNYTVTGTVIEGKKNGRKIGFPTANILPDITKLIPAGGGYAVEVNTKFGRFAGMLNIGVNPTINPTNKKTSIEVYIIDFDKDIYNETISVVFKKRLRSEKRFENTEQLALQMQLDKEETIRCFENTTTYPLPA